MLLVIKAWRRSEFTCDNILSQTVTRWSHSDWTLFTRYEIWSVVGACFINRPQACYHGYFKWIRLTLAWRAWSCRILPIFYLFRATWACNVGVNDKSFFRYQYLLQITNNFRKSNFDIDNLKNSDIVATNSFYQKALRRLKHLNSTEKVQ